MALTIRTLSDQAENTLSEIIEQNEHINTNTKAIEFVLENYLIKCEELSKEKSKSFGLLKELNQAEDKLSVIAEGFGAISEMIAK